VALDEDCTSPGSLFMRTLSEDEVLTPTRLLLGIEPGSRVIRNLISAQSDSNFGMLTMRPKSSPLPLVHWFQGRNLLVPWSSRFVMRRPSPSAPVVR
jgi:hypothetical protein